MDINESCVAEDGAETGNKVYLEVSVGCSEEPMDLNDELTLNKLVYLQENIVSRL